MYQTKIKPIDAITQCSQELYCCWQKSFDIIQRFKAVSLPPPELPRSPGPGWWGGEAGGGKSFASKHYKTPQTDFQWNTNQKGKDKRTQQNKQKSRK